MSQKSLAQWLGNLLSATALALPAEHITQCGKSRATLDATGRRHWASIRPVSPRRMPWSSISAKKIKLWHCEIAFQS